MILFVNELLSKKYTPLEVSCQSIKANKINDIKRFTSIVSEEEII